MGCALGGLLGKLPGEPRGGLLYEHWAGCWVCCLGVPLVRLLVFQLGWLLGWLLP